ncbi:MAG: inositol monophosphatase [Zetaproteobacteria bacterium CG1_02_53_45]|nr:MAG: inositol monophosphatase [Zetaproteobacteria bacterium CG1_02_53_45]
MSRSNRITVGMLADILKRAGKEIVLPAYAASVVVSSGKSDGSIVTETDLSCQSYIQAELAWLDDGIAFLGEEMTEAEQLACLHNSNGSYWCLDPLDGTTNFATNLPGFALSLALIENGLVELACIFDPVRDELFTARRGTGARLNGTPITASAETVLANAVGYIDFKRLQRDSAIAFACNRNYRSQRNLGSCALEWAWLGAGRGQFIIHGGEKVWDFSAGSLIAAEAGCIVGNFDGKPLFPDAKLSSPVLAACSRTIHDALKEQLGD